MESQRTSEEREFACQAVEPAQLNSAEDFMQEDLPYSEDRERRRMEFRCSLLEAQASLARIGSRLATPESTRQISAEFRDRRPGRMMAELANAH
jgi:hypothetical protein